MPKGNHQFKASFCPVMQIFSIFSPLLLLPKSDFFRLLIAVLLLLSGLIWYGVYSQRRVSRESSLISIIQRLLSRRLSRDISKKELREIVRKRDKIVVDRFDRLIHNCPIMDFLENITLNEFFDEVSTVLSKRLKIEKDTIYKLLWERERESSTVITPGLAIPHIVIPGEKRFDIVLARCKKGIIFNTESPPVNIAFILIGTKDERNFHLKTLAAIAQIAQDKKFDEKWLEAQTLEELRDIILLAERKRFGAR